MEGPLRLFNPIIHQKCLNLPLVLNLGPDLLRTRETKGVTRVSSSFSDGIPRSPDVFRPPSPSEPLGTGETRRNHRGGCCTPGTSKPVMTVTHSEPKGASGRVGKRKWGPDPTWVSPKPGSWTGFRVLECFFGHNLDSD